MTRKLVKGGQFYGQKCTNYLQLPKYRGLYTTLLQRWKPCHGVASKQSPSFQALVLSKIVVDSKRVSFFCKKIRSYSK